ncbi:MAG: hypothetical protein A2V67_05880 [Deltaproteobacteria bacterium RBG_13_61_14]|nr:MAG: hypothetical protein A2V67_05880 [Deltaproteobacteria bacterium RBG_13_61_14]
MRKDHLRIWVLLWIIVTWPAPLFGQPVLFPQPLSPRIANYDIEVRLDPETRTLGGKELVAWRNTSSDQVQELQFHLYLNAFRNSHSSFLLEKSREKDELKIKPEEWGFIEVDRIALASGEDLTAAMEFIHPDDDNAEDKTVFRLPLPRPVAPGETVALLVSFRARLPEPPIARAGAKKEFFFVAQWFPKVGVYQDGRWNCHQYHAHTEFFADFGVYEVRITVPEKNLVGATGVEVERRSNGDGTATHWYHAEDVHDFTWTTSPRFREYKGRAQDVEVRVLMQADHARQGPRHLAAAEKAVEYFQNWYGDYPYPNLTVVDPRPGAAEVGGMEYPTLITAGTFTGLPQGVHAVELVIIHEFGHNFWYHLVASNEFEDSWLDEGITTYAEIQISKDLYGPAGSLMDWMGIQVDDLQMRRYSYVRAPDLDPIQRNAWEYYSGSSYRANSYSKPALALITLENYLGPETMREILRAYLARYRFQHPVTADFVAVAEEVAGQDLEWFFNPALYSNAVLDYSVDRVSSRRLKPGRGYDYALSAAGEPGPARKHAAAGRGDQPEMYASEVSVRRLGEFKFPVEIEVSFADGETIRESWDGQELWKKYRYTRPAKLVAAAVDPDGKIPLDLHWGNNRRSLKEQRRAEKQGSEMLDMVKFLLRSKPE